MIQKLIALIVLSLALLLTPLSSIYAGRGCCSWHGGQAYCSNGRWVCNDGTYSPTCTCGSYYVPSAPVWQLPIPDASKAKSNYNFSTNNNLTCTQDVTINWSGETSADRYSVSLSKVAGGDPGPNVDTSNQKFTFTNKRSGKWYFNLKPGNKERWGKVWYWTIDVPKVESSFNASLDNKTKQISFNGKCLKSVNIQPLNITKTNTNSETIGFDYTGSTVFKLTGRDTYGESLNQTLSYEPYIEPTQIPTPIPTPELQKRCFLFICW